MFAYLLLFVFSFQILHGNSAERLRPDGRHSTAVVEYLRRKLLPAEDARENIHVRSLCVLEFLRRDHRIDFLAVPIEQAPLVREFLRLDDTFWTKIPPIHPGGMVLFQAMFAPAVFLPVREEVGVRGLDLDDRAFVEVAEPPHVGVLAAPGAELDGHVFILVALAAGRGAVTCFFAAAVVVPLGAVKPPRAFKAELVVQGIGLAHRVILEVLDDGILMDLFQ